MKNKEKLISILMAIIMSIAMGILFTFLARHNADENALSGMPPAPVMYLLGVVEAVIIGVLLAVIFPIEKMGRALTRKFNAAPPSFKFTALNSLPFAVINAIVCSAVCSFISIAQAHSHMNEVAKAANPLMQMWLGNWVKTLPLSIIVGYIFSLIAAPIVVSIVKPGRPPMGPGQMGPKD